jgi:L-lactate utilization protein LutC
MKHITLATDESIQVTSKNLTEHGFIPIIVNSGKEALEKILTLIPEHATVMNGASKTLEEIGFTEYFKSDSHNWKNLHKGILEEKEPTKQLQRRREAVVSDFYLGSVHAVSESGELVIASGTGSQLSHLVFTSHNVILIVSTQKITPTLSDAIIRLDEHVLPLENENMMKKLGKGTMKSKTLLFHRESPLFGRKIYVILVKEKLGF